MRHSSIQLDDLFAQLGLRNTDYAMARFIKEHPLPPDTLLQDAPFWSPSQRRFIKDSFIQDSEWAPAVDQLNLRLREH